MKKLYFAMLISIFLASCYNGGGDEQDVWEDEDVPPEAGDGQDVREDEDVPTEASVCGNGIVENGEECDNGPANSDTEPNACRTDCLAPACGDGVLDDRFGEQCDDGSLNSDERPNACRTSCLLAFCGDGVTDTGEECDDADDDNSDGCSVACFENECANGILEPGEECEGTDTRACTTICSSTGTQRCASCSWGTTCDLPEESCNGIDDDCDGTIDNGSNDCGGACPLDPALDERCDGPDADLCRDDTYICADLNATTCSVGPDDCAILDWCDDFGTFQSDSYYVATDCGGWSDTEQRYILASETPPDCRSRIFYTDRSFELNELSVGFSVVMSGGLDGFTVAFVEDPAYPRTCCGFLDFEGATGYAIEFDMFENFEWDPVSGGQHVALLENGISEHLAWAPINLDNDELHQIQVIFDAGSITVEVDDASMLYIPVFSGLPGSLYYVGFTAGTPGSPGSIHIDDFCISAL